MSFALSVVSECPLSEGADCRQLREIGRFPYSLADALSLVCPYIITPFDCVCQAAFYYFYKAYCLAINCGKLSPPHQSLTRQTACSFLPPRGEAFLTMCEQGKWDFESWDVFTIRPHPSPAAPPSPSKGKALVRNVLI